MANISEVFPAFQGEGSSQGKNVVFVRYSGCNCSCESCDTPYTWKKDKFESTSWTTEDIVKEIKKHNTKTVVFTGGEPVGIYNNFINTIEIMKILGGLYHFEYETNGVISYNKEKFLKIIEEHNLWLNVKFNISPKINFTQERDNSVEPNLINILDESGEWIGGVIIKFLFKDNNDIKIIDDFIKLYEISNNQVYVQPIGINSNDLKKTIIDNYDEILKRGWNLSMRSHVFLFENKKGV